MGESQGFPNKVKIKAWAALKFLRYEEKNLSVLEIQKQRSKQGDVLSLY